MPDIKNTPAQVPVQLYIEECVFLARELLGCEAHAIDIFEKS